MKTIPLTKCTAVTRLATKRLVVCGEELGNLGIIAPQYSAAQYSTVQCSTVQCSTVQCSTVQHSGHLVVQPKVLGEAVAQEDETSPLLPLPVVAVQLLGPPVGERGGGGDDPAHHTRDT